MLRYLLALLLLMASAQAETRAKERVALVFGMAAYQNVTALKNTVSDATALARTLEQIGFHVDVQMDATRAETLVALEKFAFEAETADIALIYYAGHGVSVQGPPSDPGRREGTASPRYRRGLGHDGSDAGSGRRGAEDVGGDPGQLPRQPLPRCDRPA
ncbi:MAG: caspase family protein, partial [Polaromonas sp.]|nr:caspase family protein [Polaromonas sp.]